MTLKNSICSLASSPLRPAVAAALLLSCLAPSCRRPVLAEDDRIFLEVTMEGRDAAGEEDENCLVGFYGADGRREGYDFVRAGSPQAVCCPAGTHDVLVYSLGSRSTRVEDGGTWSSVRAVTSEVNVDVRDCFSEARAVLASYMHAMGMDPLPTKAGFEDGTVIGEPDALWAFAARGREVPLRGGTQAGGGYSMSVTARDVTVRGSVSLRVGSGAEWIAGACAYLSNLCACRPLDPGQPCGETSSVYIPLEVDAAAGTLSAPFRCFGAMDGSAGYENTLYVVVTDLSLARHLFAYNVTDMVLGASPDGVMDIDLGGKPIVMEEPEGLPVPGDAFRAHMMNWSEEFVGVELGQGKKQGKKP